MATSRETSIGIKEAPPGVIAFDYSKIIIYSLIVGSLFFARQVKAETVKALPVNAFAYRLIELDFSPNFYELNLDRLGGSVELIEPVPGERTLIAVPQTKPEGRYRPDERNEGRVGVEQQNELSPDDYHKFWRLLLTQLLAFAAVFPAGVYISMRRNIHRDWRNSIPKGRLPKMPVMGILSISCLPRQIKSRRWLLWEQRSRFIDMKVCKGFENAYLSIWRWKKLVAEKW